jgi:hypothetical protein
MTTTTATVKDHGHSIQVRLVSDSIDYFYLYNPEEAYAIYAALRDYFSPEIEVPHG